MTPHDALFAGMAALLVAAPGAGITYRQSGAYPDDEIGVYRDELPPVGPAVALHVYGEEIVDRSSIRYLVQARIRGTRDLSEAVRVALSWIPHPLTPAGIDVVQIRPLGYADLGRTGGHRLWTRNFSALT